MKVLIPIGIGLVCLVLNTAVQGQAAEDLNHIGWSAYSSNEKDVFSGIHNQAALAELNDFSAGAFVQQKFSLSELNQYHFIVGLPTASGNFSFQGFLSGFEQFKRERLALGYARSLFDWLKIGARLEYLHLNVPTYGQARAITFTLATLIHINEQVHLGAQVYNPAKAAYSKLGEDRIASLYQMGMAYQPSKLFLFAIEWNLRGSEEAGSFSFLYHLAPALSIGGGINTRDFPVFGTVAVRLKNIEILISASSHDQLGLTPGAGFIYRNRKEYDD